MTSFDNIRLEKGLYKTGKSFTEALESIDPSENYTGTDLEGLDAFQRQLKRFDIKVSGSNSDPIEKFFKTSDSAALFPEYISRAVKQGIDNNDILNSIIATTTCIEGLDYRTIEPFSENSEAASSVVAEGAEIPEATIRTKEHLIKLHKRGRMLSASYEAIRFQRLDLFTIALKQIGASIARAQLEDAVNTLINGDGNNNSIKTVAPGQSDITYADILNLWLALYPYKLTTLITSPSGLHKLLQLDEFSDSKVSSFKSTGKLITPFGAEIVCYENLAENTVIGLDKNFSLEKVQAGPVVTEFDKLIDRQIERAAITATTGFAKIFDEASALLGNS